MVERFTPTLEQLAEIVSKNRAWFFGEPGGERADLSDAYLRGAYLSGADLSGADLRGADLRGADLSGAYLRDAYLRGADLSDAYLRGAYLSGADLSGADLRGADLSGADLSGAYLRDAYLRGADLRGADLSGADLSGADLRGADLRGADLRGADLRDCQMNWQSHDLIAERLRQAAGKDAYKTLAAGYILMNRRWCWLKLLKKVPPQISDLQPWVFEQMRLWIKEGDGAPEILTAPVEASEESQGE